MRADPDTILEDRVREFEVPPTERVKDTVLEALFSIAKVPPPPLRDHANRCRGLDEDEARSH